MNAQSEKLLKLVENHGPISAAALARKLGAPLSTTERLLMELSPRVIPKKRGRSKLWMRTLTVEEVATKATEIKTIPDIGAIMIGVNVDRQTTAIGHEELAEAMAEKVESLGLGDRAEDYPEEWLDANQPISVGATEDAETFEIRRGGKKLGEISEIDLKDRARYQITSPWEPKSYDRMSEAIAALAVDSGGE